LFLNEKLSKNCPKKVLKNDRKKPSKVPKICPKNPAKVPKICPDGLVFIDFLCLRSPKRAQKAPFHITLPKKVSKKEAFPQEFLEKTHRLSRVYVCSPIRSV
jgi:hypothetical protein